MKKDDPAQVSAPTAEFRDLWLPPVDDVAGLPARADEGQLCFVERDGGIYMFWDGVWSKQAQRAPRR